MLTQCQCGIADIYPVNAVLGMEQHVMEMLTVLVGGQQVAQALHGQVVDVLPQFTPECPDGLDGSVAGDGTFMGVKYAGEHLMVDTRNQFGLVFNMDIKADMQFDAGNRSSGEADFSHTCGIGNSTGNHDCGSAGVYIAAGECAGSIVFGYQLAAYPDTGTLGLEGIGHPIDALGIEGEAGRTAVSSAQDMTLIHHGVQAVIVVVDKVALLECAEGRTRNPHHAEEFGLVEFAWNEGHHVRRDRLEMHRQDQGNEPVAQQNAFCGAHVSTFKDATQRYLAIGQHEGVLDGLVTGRQQIIGRQTTEAGFIALQRTGMYCRDHGPTFGHGVCGISNGAFENLVAPFRIVGCFRYNETAIVIPERVDKSALHGGGTCGDVRHLLLVGGKLLCHVDCSNFLLWPQNRGYRPLPEKCRR